MIRVARPELTITGRGIAGAGAALVAGFAGLLLSQSLALTRADPERALAAWRWNGSARAEQASALLAQGQGAAAVSRARALSVAALQDQVLTVPAVRTLGVAAAIGGEQRAAAQAMAFGETLSRRDLPVELWWIENRVAAGDIAGALVHYDRALTTADSAPDLLLPVLVGAAADPAVARPLARLLARRPLWWRDYATRLVQANPPGPGTATILAALRLDPNVAEERDLLSTAMTRFADAGRADLALRLAPGETARGTLRNGGFEAEPSLAPFDWRLVEDGELAAAIDTRGGGGNVLFLDARGGRGGEVARQLLALAPGRYRITGIVGEVATPAESPALVITCAGTARPLGRLAVGAAAAAGKRFAGSFTVPQRCVGQWLTVEATSPLEISDRRPWLDDLAIVRTPL